MTTLDFKKGKTISLLSFLFFNIVFLLICPIHAAENRTYDQDEAVFKYRDLLNQYKTHQPDLLRKILLMQLNHHDVMPRFNIAEAMGELGDPVILKKLWKVIIEEKTPVVRLGAVEGMLLTQNKSSVPYLLKLLNDEDTLIRRKAAFGCGELGDESTTPELGNAFFQEKDKLNKITIAAAMAKLGDKKKLEFINDSLLKDANPEARYHLVNLLHIFNIALDNLTLKQVMKNEMDPYVKVWLACLLAKNEDKDSLLYLKNVVANGNEIELKSEAAKALCHLDELEYVYPFLLNFLKEKNWEIRESAIEDLNNFKEFPLVSILGEVLLNDENSTVREIAAWALGERKDKVALPYLEKGLYDTSVDVRTGVIVALYKILTSQEGQIKSESILRNQKYRSL